MLNGGTGTVGVSSMSTVSNAYGRTCTASNPVTRGCRPPRLRPLPHGLLLRVSVDKAQALQPHGRSGSDKPSALVSTVERVLIGPGHFQIRRPLFPAMLLTHKSAASTAVQFGMQRFIEMCSRNADSPTKYLFH